jgi:hypothetical protein
VEEKPFRREAGAVSRVYLLVEGQTEETFVRELLEPHFSRIGLYLIPIIVSTSQGHKGGVVRYAQVKPQIERLCKQGGGAFVSTMFDLYRLPNDFPGKRDSAWSQQGTGHQKADFVESCMAQDIGRRNFIPNIMVHEYEALLFAQPERFLDWADQTVAQTLVKARQTAMPEEINDAPDTAPSKRILAVMPNYQKPFHGPLIACEIGIDTMRAECPHFNGWISRLEKLKTEN